eukprot:1158055-Pelagomonas_calceolata.AAC.3
MAACVKQRNKQCSDGAFDGVYGAVCVFLVGQLLSLRLSGHSLGVFGALALSVLGALFVALFGPVMQ